MREEVERRMETISCGKCKRYSHALTRCIDGKVNPRQKNHTMNCVEFYGGWETICQHNKWKKQHIDAVLAKIIYGEKEA